MITTRSIGMDDIKPSDAESYPIRLCASLVAHWKNMPPHQISQGIEEIDAS